MKQFSPTIIQKTVFKKYKITHVTTPIQHSTSNAQVERAHSTLIELIRCLSKRNDPTSSKEIFNAVKAYNHTIHSVIGERPIDQNPNKYTNIILTIFALNLITNCVKDNKISTMAFAFGIKLAVFMFLKILQDALTH